ncbi:MAG: hypothetical protein WB626_12810 [Bacteroidota bacterium]
MKLFTRWLPVCLALIFIPAGCTKDQTSEPAPSPFSGILETDSSCTIIGGDTTDFLPRPTLSGPPQGTPSNYSLIMACPNPVPGDTTTIEFQIPVTDSVWLEAFVVPSAAPVATILRERLPAGVYRILWGFSGANRIYRVQMSTQNGFSSYGDVEFR